jgi:hypothetical protein
MGHASKGSASSSENLLRLARRRPPIEARHAVHALLNLEQPRI